MDPSTAFEKDWLGELLPNERDEVYDRELNMLPPTAPAVVVFNHSIDYERYLQSYTDAGKAFVAMHLSDETLGDSSMYLDSPQCLVAFRNYHSPAFDGHPKVVTLGLGYKTGFGNAAGANVKWPWFHWCFAGNIHGAARADALQQAAACMRPFLVHSTTDGFNSPLSLGIREYRSMMESSKFAICPPGQGNLDTFRVYEALEAGCIPVVLGNAPLQHYGVQTYWGSVFGGDSVPFVVGDSWDQCMERALEILADPMLYAARRHEVTGFWLKWKRRWASSVRAACALLGDAR